MRSSACSRQKEPSPKKDTAGPTPDLAAGPGNAASPAPKLLQPALAAVVAGVVAAPLPDTGVGSVGALEALLRERTLETGGPDALSQLVAMSQTAGVTSSAPSMLQPPPPPPPPAVSDSGDEARHQRKKRNLGLGNGASAVGGVADAAVAAPSMIHPRVSPAPAASPQVTSTPASPQQQPQQEVDF